MNMDGRVLGQFTRFPQPGSKPGGAQGANGWFNFVVQDRPARNNPDRKIHYTAVVMGAKACWFRRGIASLGDGAVCQVDLSAVDLLGVLQHGEGALVENNTIDFHAAVIIHGFQATSRFIVRKGRGFNCRCWRGSWCDCGRERGGWSFSGGICTGGCGSGGQTRCTAGGAGSDPQQENYQEKKQPLLIVLRQRHRDPEGWCPHRARRG